MRCANWICRVAENVFQICRQQIAGRSSSRGPPGTGSSCAAAQPSRADSSNRKPHLPNTDLRRPTLKFLPSSSVRPGKYFSMTEQQPPPSDKGSGESLHFLQQETPLVSPGHDYVFYGRPLVELFAVRAGFHFVGTIAVFDGMRGQVIYKNENNGGAPIHSSSWRLATDNDQGSASLLLTGPYRAISAYGSFTIEVDIRGAGMAAQQGQCTGSSIDMGELNWDCYDEEKVYDKPVIETITTSRGGQKVEVTYAVLSDAVDVELEVHIRLPGATAEGRGAVVYGCIATRSKAFHGEGEDLAWSVLFDSVEGVSLVADRHSSIARLPLARSVVAMPLGSPLVIMATLYDAPPCQHGVRPIFQCLDMEVTLGGRMRRPFADNDGEFEMIITSPDYYPRPMNGEFANHN